MKPLEGVKVIEFANNLAAPTVGRNLADWGADVIKIEPLKGDVWRKNGPAQNCPLTENVNPVFDNENLNKHFVAVDTRHEKGRKIILRLLEDAVIFITNYRDEALIKMGLDYDSLKNLFPGLIYAQLLGYGPKGPDAKKPGYDYTVFFAHSGIMMDMSPAGGDPCNGFTGMGDHATASNLTAGILAALYRRTITGQGDYVCSALLQTACYMLGTPLMTGFYGSSLYKSRKQAKQPFSNTFQGSDGGWFYLAAPDFYRDFGKCCHLIGRPELINDPRCATIADARANIEAIVDIIDEAFQSKTCAEWVTIFQEADFPCEPLKHVEDLCRDPQVLENNFARRYTYADGTEAIASCSPVSFASYDVNAEQVKVSGGIGADNDAVLLANGYTNEEISALKNAGILG